MSTNIDVASSDALATLKKETKQTLHKKFRVDPEAVQRKEAKYFAPRENRSEGKYLIASV